MTACPATKYIDSGDMAEPEECGLPLEHNVEGSWHEASWKTDQEEMVVRWAPEFGETCHWRPKGSDPLYGGLGAEQRTFYNAALLERLLPRLPLGDFVTSEPRPWRRMASLPVPNPNYRYSDEPPVVVNPEQSEPLT